MEKTMEALTTTGVNWGCIGIVTILRPQNPFKIVVWGTSNELLDDVGSLGPCDMCPAQFTDIFCLVRGNGDNVHTGDCCDRMARLEASRDCKKLCPSKAHY